MSTSAKFLLFSIQFNNNSNKNKNTNYRINEKISKKLRYWAWDLNPGPQKMKDHRRIQIFRHQPMTAFDPFMLHK